MDCSAGFRVALYLRKSRHDAEAEARGEGETLSKHRRALLELAAARGDCVAAVYEEVASGERLRDRPAARQMLRDVERGNFQAVLCMDLDRLGRGNLIDQGRVHEAFQSSGTLVVTPRKLYDLRDEMDEEWTEFEAFMARRELKIITRRLQRGRRLSAAGGKSVSRRPPYGYARGSDGVLRPEPAQAEVVRSIFRLAAEGRGLRAIAGRLNSLGIPSPSGRDWAPSSIRWILHNPAYDGDIVWGRSVWRKTRTGLHRTPAPRETWTVARGAHEPLVDSGLSARARRGAQSEKTPKTPRAKTVANPLAALLRCGRCGRTMLRRKGYGGREDRLLCATPGCETRSVAVRPVLEALVKAISDALDFDLSPVLAHPAVCRPEDALSDTAKRRLRELAREEAECRRQWARAHDLLELGVYERDQFSARKAHLETRLSDLRQRRESALAALPREAKPPSGTLDFPDGAQTAREMTFSSLWSLFQTPERQNELLRSLVRRAALRNDGGDGPEGRFVLEVELFF